VKSARCEPGIAHRVTLLSRIEIVRFSIKLHDEVRRVAYEVDHISTHRGLSAECKPIKTMRLEIAPQ